MDIKTVASLLGARILTPGADLTREVYWAYGADLLSDVLAFTRPETLLLTGLINNQVIRTAEMVDLGGIVVVRGKFVQPEFIALAEQANIPLLFTEKTMFESCGKLYIAGLQPCEKRNNHNVRAAL